MGVDVTKKERKSSAKWDLLAATSHNRKGNEAADDSWCHTLDNLGMNSEWCAWRVAEW